MSDKDCKARELAEYAFLTVFADDETIDGVELAVLKRLALSDGIVDDREREVLARIFARVDRGNVTAEVWEGIVTFKQRFGID